MSLRLASWEEQLLDWANEGLSEPAVVGIADYEEDLLRQAYERCELIAREHSLTFHLAASLLSREKRKGIHALYAFCRLSDDLVDRPGRAGAIGLGEWRRRVQVSSSHETEPVLVAWSDTRQRFGIPTRYAEQLIDGVARDLEQTRYESFDDLAEYCYGVASTVGLMAMHIVGFVPTAVRDAVKLGVALQLTNILRDIGEDWRMGRLYLPLSELRDFGLDETDIERGVVDDRWRGFMAHQIARARRLYDESMPGLVYLDADGRFAVAAAAELYRAILGRIEANDFEVFHNRAYVATTSKLLKLPGIWWRVRRLRARGP